jgi:DNA-directed RNA polymerase III subunit RPC8
MSEGLIGHGTGLVNVNGMSPRQALHGTQAYQTIVEFRMTVFRPFRGEIIYGKIKNSTENGIVIGMEFTSEVFIPYQNLPPDCHFDHGENAWIWKTEGGPELFFDRGEPVLFRVEREQWYDQKPTLVQKGEDGEPIEQRGTAWRLIVSAESCHCVSAC